MHKAIFLDRDGTLNEEVNYLKKPEEIKIFSNTVPALLTFKSLGFLNIIVTNQSGIARGFLSEEDLDVIHNQFRKLLRHENTELIDSIYYSPFHPDAVVDVYKTDSPDRKPGTGMISKAADKFNIDISESFLIGDSYTDMKCAFNAGLRSILVKTGYGYRDEKLCLENEISPEYIAEDIYDASLYVKNLFVENLNKIRN